MEIKLVPLDSIKANVRNARTHSAKQLMQIERSIQRFGFCNPILVDEARTIIAGHGRHEAAKSLAMKEIPIIELTRLSPTKKRALALADNKIAENAGWDRELLAVELSELSEILIDEDFDISITGFAAVEVDQLSADFEENASDPADEVDPKWLSPDAVTQSGDVWTLGGHRILCGDARDPDIIARLMGSNNRAGMAFLDPPYNVRVRDVVGRGRVKHGEFAMASGEMSPPEFVGFLNSVLESVASVSVDGAVHYVCMDWRHIGELLEAGHAVYSDVLNLVAWVKSNAGLGTFYRSQHELIGVFRVGKTPHLNNIELGRHGRNRTNVWHYAGANTFRAGRMEDLGSHPTVKPIALVADAIKDCTRRGDIVVDTFCGSGTTVLAAERVGRRAFALEIEPRFVDVAIRRWQAFTRKDAIHESGRTFDERAAQRIDATLPLAA
jgi:DNA modification methylase